jgi:beta-aspartyl-peptidase (threonine type)
MQKRRKLSSDYFKKLHEMAELYETVGVVAIDREGLISVATSTGGISMHLPGRVGDTPVIGCGTYADKNGGASTTGHGEAIMRTMLALKAVNLMARYPAAVAGKKAIAYATKMGCRGGIIGLDRRGRIMCVNNTQEMSWCFIKDGDMRVFNHGVKS